MAVLCYSGAAELAGLVGVLLYLRHVGCESWVERDELMAMDANPA